MHINCVKDNYAEFKMLLRITPLVRDAKLKLQKKYIQ